MSPPSASVALASYTVPDTPAVPDPVVPDVNTGALLVGGPPSSGPEP